jgi:membrane associated rhomboid family serine protease
MEATTQAAATYALIAVTTLVSFYALFMDRSFASHFAFQAGAVQKGEHYRVITSSFLHVDVFHLFVNMLTLFFFGPTVEQLLGTLGFLVVYFGSIIASGLVSQIVHRNNPGYASLGASDAVSGIVLSFCVFYPLAPIYLFGIPWGIPAILYGALFIVISAQLMGRPGARIAHEGHLGGALGGLLLTVLMKPEAVSQFFQ